MKKILLAIVMLVVVLGAAAMAAQPPPSSTAAQEGFVPVSSIPQTEQLPAAPLLIASYAFVWVALIVYVWLLWRRLTRVERELADLNRRLQQR